MITLLLSLGKHIEMYIFSSTILQLQFAQNNHQKQLKMSKVTLALCVLLLASYVIASSKFSTELKAVQPLTDTPLPYDDGSGNWGDKVYQQRQDGDDLLLRDLVIANVSIFQQDLQYSVQFSKKQAITSVRLINVGRQRAYCTSITIGGKKNVDVFFTIPANKDPRVFIELYGL
ncbi:hypothetical protein HHI36_018642 [Cryptolaemus montrouzieri]|uniref:Uncharacterized protein n=1 Tax=Cryptolaemus montrouzieri TaxID=559131 RepID=A0ABD2P0Y0_9CUCU